MRLLVTGAAGWLGQLVVKDLAARPGYEVAATDASACSDLPIAMTVADLRDWEQAQRLVRGMDAVIHLGNVSDVGRGQPQEIFRDNCAINANIFQAAAEAGVGKVVFASSIQIISGGLKVGDSAPSPLPYLPLDEEVSPNPGNLYAASKMAAEDLLLHYARHCGMSCVSLRLPGVWNPKYCALVRLTRDRRPLDAAVAAQFKDEAFATLAEADVPRVFRYILQADLNGYHLFLAAAKETMTGGLTLAEIVETFYPNVPLRISLDQLDSLVDTSRIEKATGWKPLPVDFGDA